MSAKITIIPTSHIARESIRQINEAIEREKPDCIAVELDAGRYQALQEGEAPLLESLRALGPVTFIFFFVLKGLQDSLGRAVGIMPGADMMEAVRLGRLRGINVAFIDRDIGETFLRIKAVPAREKMRLLLFALMAATGLGLKIARQPGDKKSFDLSKVPPENLVEEALIILKRRFPWLHRILIEERNAYMAQRIGKLSTRYNNVLVVVGAGHAKGIEEILFGNQWSVPSATFTVIAR